MIRPKITIGDLLREDEEWEGSYLRSTFLGGRLIAKDSMDGHILFDTGRSAKDRIQGFFSGEVEKIWASTKTEDADFGFCGERVIPVIKAYIRHDSWKEPDEKS